MAAETTGPANYKNEGIKKCQSSDDIKGKKKGVRGMHVIRAAVHLLRKNKKNEKKMDTENKQSPLSLPANDAIGRLVGSVRPLHMSSNVGGFSPPPPPPVRFPTESPDRGSEASFFSVSSPSPSIGGNMSRYASSQSLYELGITDEDEINVINEEVDAYYDGLEGDEFIDSKADKFIAQFYNQKN